MVEFQTLGDKEESRRQEAFFGLITLRPASDSPAPPLICPAAFRCAPFLWGGKQRKEKAPALKPKPAIPTNAPEGHWDDKA